MFTIAGTFSTSHLYSSASRTSRSFCSLSNIRSSVSKSTRSGRDGEPDHHLLELNLPWWNHWKPHPQVPRVESKHSSSHGHFWAHGPLECSLTAPSSCTSSTPELAPALHFVHSFNTRSIHVGHHESRTHCAGMFAWCAVHFLPAKGRQFLVHFSCMQAHKHYSVCPTKNNGD